MIVAAPRPSLRMRVLTACVLIPAVVFILLKGGVLFLGMTGLAFGFCVAELWQMARRTNIPLVMGAGGLYLALCFVSFLYLRLVTVDGVYLTLSLMLCVWASDSAAYLAGKCIGGPRLWPSLSPNKTWAGLAGAVLGFGVSLFLLAFMAPYVSFAVPNALQVNWFGALAVGCFLGAVCQAGDLLVSFLKRWADVKDTGTIIAGHGGILDRIDALLLVTPVFLLIASAF